MSCSLTAAETKGSESELRADEIQRLAQVRGVKRRTRYAFACAWYFQKFPAKRAVSKKTVWRIGNAPVRR